MLFFKLKGSLAILLLGIVCPAISQTAYTGKVLDETGAPLPFANALLLNKLDSSLVKGDITDLEGQFYFESKAGEDLFVKIYATGYEEHFADPSPGNMIDFGEVQLAVSTTQLGEVYVTAQKPIFEQKIDRTVVNVAQNISVTGGTALDVLQRSPGITINQMSSDISLNGKSGVRVMINGKISRLPVEAVFRMLAATNADNIESVELISTPPARYEAEGDAGIINIILKKGVGIGTNGSVSAFLGYGRRIKYGSNINFNSRKNRFNFYGDYGYSSRFTTQHWLSERSIMIDSDEVHVTGNNERDAVTNVHNGRLGFDFEASDKTVISSFVSYMDRAWDMDAISQIDIDTNSVLSNELAMTTLEKNNFGLLLSNVNLTHKINAGTLISFDLDYIVSSSDNPTDYIQDYNDLVHTISYQDELKSTKTTPIKTWVSKVDVSGKAANNISWEIGGKISLSYLENEILVQDLDEGAWIVDQTLTSDAQMNEDIFAGYFASTFPINDRNEIQAGVRYEHTITDLDTRDTPNLVYRNYGNFFPSFFYQNKINQNQSAVFSYSRRVSRPSFFQIAPFVIFSDPNSFFSGNEKLLPSFTHQLKLEYRIKSLMLGLQYSKDENSISIFQPEITEDNKMVSKAQNMDFVDNYGVTLSLPFGITDWWDAQVNMVGSYVYQEASFTNNQFSSEIYTLNINGNTKMKLPRDFNFEISGFYASPQFWGISKMKMMTAINVGLEKKLSSGSFRVNMNDIFLGSRMRWSTLLPEENIIEYGTIDFEPRLVRLSYVHNFGQETLKGKRNRKTASEEEQRRFN